MLTIYFFLFTKNKQKKIILKFSVDPDIIINEGNIFLKKKKNLGEEAVGFEPCKPTSSEV